MKKRVFILCILLLGLLVNKESFAQPAIGIKGSAQMTKLDSKWLFDDETEIKWLLTPDFGIIANFWYENTISFQIEINYSPKASEIDLLDEEFKQINNYIDLPLLLKAKFGSNDIKYYGIVGVTTSFALTINTEMADEVEKFNVISEADQPLQYYMDIALSIGGGLSLELANGELFAELRYNHGIGNTIDFGDYDSKALRLSVGYLFHL